MEVKILLILAILLLCIAVTIYLGIGFLLSLSDGDHPSRKERIKTIFGWPKLLWYYLTTKDLTK